MINWMRKKIFAHFGKLENKPFNSTSAVLYNGPWKNAAKKERGGSKLPFKAFPRGGGKNTSGNWKFKEGF